VPRPFEVDRLPLRMSDEDSYAEAYPFDKLVEGMLNLQMIEDTTSMILEAAKKKREEEGVHYQ
jgi:hypothetical protein